MAGQSIRGGKSLFIVTLFFLNQLTAGLEEIYNKAWCDKMMKDKITSAFTNDGPLFFKSFSAMIEESVSQSDDTNPTSLSLSTVRFSDHDGQQMSMQRKSHGGYFSSFVDPTLNVCLLEHQRNGQCVKAEQPCSTISQLTDSVTLKGHKVSLKSARQSLGWDPQRFKVLVKVDPKVIRGINSTVYATCANDETNSATVISLWYFLDITINSGKDGMPVLLRAYHQTQDDKQKSLRTVRTDYIDFKQLRNKIRPPLDLVNSDCISDNRNYVNKRIPTPPTSFSFIRETYIRRPDTSDRDIDVEKVYYNYDADWFHYDVSLSSLDDMEKTELKVVEDFTMGVRYEITKLTKLCTAYPNLSRAAHEDTTNGLRMKTPNEFWSIDPDTAVYLGGIEVRGVPCDAWQVKLSSMGENNNTTYKLFLATNEWLKRNRRPLYSFLPIQSIEDSGSGVKYHHYFEFKRNMRDFVPNVFTCFNSKHSETVGLTLLTSFHKTIQHHRLQFELKLRRTVLQISGIASALRLTKIRANPSLVAPFQSRISFTILDRSEISSNISKVQDLVPTSEVVTRLKKAVETGKFELTLVTQSGSVHVKAKTDSMTLLEHDAGLLDYGYIDEKTPSSGYSIGVVVGLCILAVIVGVVGGVGAVYGYKRWSDKELDAAIAENAQRRPQSTASTTKLDFGMLQMHAEDDK